MSLYASLDGAGEGADQFIQPGKTKPQTEDRPSLRLQFWSNEGICV